MKNKRITYIIYFMVVIILVTLFVLIKYYTSTIDKDVLYKYWYKYDTTTGYYTKLYFEDETFSFYKPSNTNVRGKYDYCTKYVFDKKSKSFNLNCGEKIILDKYQKDKLILIINDKKTVFFLNPEDSLNYEFESYFNKSMSEYKLELNQNTEIIKVNYERMKEIIQEKDNSTIIFMGNNCSSIECTLFLDVLEKWISTNEKVYYVNINEIDDTSINELKNTVKGFNTDRDYYNDIYPRIVVFNNNRVMDQYQIKCKGFNCTKYIKY